MLTKETPLQPFPWKLGHQFAKFWNTQIKNYIKAHQDNSSHPTNMSEVDQQSESALRENISRKGANSYYYAHGNTANGPAWDGKEQPRLLAVATEQIVVSKPLARSFESFSWLDETKNVRVYIDFPEANSLSEEHISLVIASAF